MIMSDRARQKKRNLRRFFSPSSETLESRELLAASPIIRSGGVGGITESLSLPSDLNLIKFTWQNYSIKDEFQIQYQGRRIAGDVGVQSGGHTGKTVFAGNNSTAGALAIKVTAPTQGTAWDFTVSADPLELKVDAKLGDVTKVSIGKLIKDASGFTMDSVGIDPKTFQFVSTTNAKGSVAEVDQWQNELKKGIFYFVPKVAGTPLAYGTNHTASTDAGIGDSELRVRATVTNKYGAQAATYQIEFPIKFSVTDGFSTSLPDPEVAIGPAPPAVNGAGTTKLDIYRQEQRLAYLGFPGSGGTPLSVDGTAGADEGAWAMKLFSIALDPATSPTSRGSVQSPAQQKKFFKDHINDANAIQWNHLSSISNINLTAGRQYGLDASGRLIASALSTLGRGPIDHTRGVAAKNGTGSPSVSHEGGRAFDFDDIPGDYYFNEVTGPGGVRFVKANSASGGGFIYRDATGYHGGGLVTNSNQVAGAVRVLSLISDTTPTRTKAIETLIDYKRTRAEVQAVFDAFSAAGATQILHNDPRFFSDGALTLGWTGVKFFNVTNHFNHIHVYIPSPLPSSAPSAPAFAPLAPALRQALASGRLSNVVDLGRLETNHSVSGTLNNAQPEVIFRFEIGNADEPEAFDPLRDLTALLNGLSDNVDLELIIDPNGDGNGEMIFSSANSGTAAETINALQQPTSVYYLRVFKRASDTPFNLSLSLAPLPVPPDNAGHNVATANNLGVLTGNANRSDFVGTVDPQDLYKFQLTGLSDLTVNLTGLDQGDASLALGQDLNNDGILDLGEVQAFSDAGGNATESLALFWLPAGNYLVQVLQVSGGSNYQIQFSQSNVTAPTDQAGDTPATARDLGALTTPKTANDFVGKIDPFDLYKFTLPAVAGVTLDLSGLSSDADLTLYRDANTDGVLSADERLVSSSLSGTAAEQIRLAGLRPGTYFVLVNQYEGDTTYNLALTPQTASGSDVSVARTGTAPTSDLGTQFTYSVQVTNNGPDAASNVRLTEDLGPGQSLVSVTGGSFTRTSAGFVADTAALAPGANVKYDITVFSFQAGSLPTFSSVTSDTADFDLSNNVFTGINTVNTIASPPADLEITQTVSNANPDVGDQITLTLSVLNRGPGTATVIRVLDKLPAGLSFVSASADLGTYNSATGVWDVGNLLPNATVQLRIRANVASGTRLANTAEIIAVDETDPDSTPNNNLPTEDDQTSVEIVVGAAGAVTGRKWSDDNSNGVHDAGEAWLNGWTIELYGDAGALVSTTTTADFDVDGNGTIDPATETGWYRFNNLADGDYRVDEAARPGWQQSYPTHPLAALAYQLDVNTNFLTTQNDFLDWAGLNERWIMSNDGWHFVTPAGGLFKWLSGRGETLQAQLVAKLNPTFYNDLNLLASPAAPQTHQVSITTGSQVTGIDFGNYGASTIEGQKWEDSDRDGIRDSGERFLNGWQFQLINSDTGAVVKTTTTQSLDLNLDGWIDPESEVGVYLFEGVTPGKYEVREVLKTGWIQSTPTQDLLTLARSLDTSRDFQTSNGSFLNWGNLSEKWLLGNDGWYFITPDGALSKWNLSPRTALTGTKVAQLSPWFYQQLSRLTDAADPADSLIDVTDEIHVTGLNVGNYRANGANGLLINGNADPRLVPGNVRVWVSGADIRVTGDQFDNQVALFVDWRHNLIAVGLQGTTINGQTGPVVLLQNAWTVPGSVYADLGSGHDLIALQGFKTGRNVWVNAGAGIDSILALNMQVGGNFDVISGWGAGNVGISNSSIANNLTIWGSEGRDNVILDKVVVSNFTSINLGAGGDRLLTRGSIFHDDTRISLSYGDDVLVALGTNDFKRLLFIDGSLGTDATSANSVTAGQKIVWGVESSSIPNVEVLLDQILSELAVLGLDASLLQ